MQNYPPQIQDLAVSPISYQLGICFVFRVFYLLYGAYSRRIVRNYEQNTESSEKSAFLRARRE